MKYPTIHLDHLLNGKAVEWERLELKSGWNPLDVLHTVCAFANDFHNLGGGYIVVGVSERDGRPVLPAAGLDASKLNAIQKEILNLGHQAIQPQYHPIVIPETLNGRHVIVIWTPGGPTRPYKAKLGLGKDCRGGAISSGRDRVPFERKVPTKRNCCRSRPRSRSMTGSTSVPHWMTCRAS